MAPTPPQGRAGQHAGSRKDEQPEAPLQEERAWQQPGAPSQEEGAWQPGAPSQEAGACSPAPAQFRAAWEEELTPVSRR